MCYDEFFRLNNNKILGVTKNTLWDGSKYKTFDYKYNFISLNGTRKKHRVMLVRQMYQQKILFIHIIHLKTKDNLITHLT